MNFTNHPQPFKNKLSSLCIAGLVHLILIALVIQGSSHLIINRIDPIITIEKPFEKPIEPKEPEIVPEKLKIPESKFPVMPDFEIEKPPILPTLRPDEDVLKNQTKNIDQNGSDPFIKGHEINHENTRQTPQHISAKVDASACEKPHYPLSSLRNGEEGNVTLAMLIGVDGQVLESRVEKTSGYKTLDKAALEGLRLCKFTPGSFDGVAEKSWVKLNYGWTIQ